MSHCLCCSTWGFHKDDPPLGWYRQASISSSCTAADVKLELCVCYVFFSCSGTRAWLKFFGRLTGTWGCFYSYNLNWNKSLSKCLFWQMENIIEHNGFSCAKSSSNFSLEWYLVSFSLLSLWKHSCCNLENLSLWPSLTSSPLHRIFQQVLLTAVLSLLAAQFI